MSSPPSPVQPTGAPASTPDAPNSFLVPPVLSSAVPAVGSAGPPGAQDGTNAPTVESLYSSLKRSATEFALLSARLDSARGAAQSTLVAARSLLGDGGPGSILRSVQELVTAKDAAEHLLARVQSNLVARETDLVVERNSRVAAEAYVAALRDQLDTETRQAAETIGQLRSDLAVVNNKVDAWSKRFQTVGSVEASLRASIAPLKAQREAQGWQAASLQLDLDRACDELDSARQDASQKSAPNWRQQPGEAPSAASSPRPPSALAPVTEHVLRARVRELEGELAAARSSAETSRTTVESLLDALRARAKDQEEVLNKSAEVVGTLRDSNLALGQECDELRVRLDVAEQDALKANRRFADAVPIFWDWVVRQFAVERAELVPSLVASWKAGEDPGHRTGSSDARPAGSLRGSYCRPRLPVLGGGASSTKWCYDSGGVCGCLHHPVDAESDDTESPPDTPPSSPAIKRSSDGSGPGKAEKARKTPPAPCGVQGLAHDDLPPSVVVAYEEVIAARPWERFHTQVSFVPKAFRADAEWKALHQSLVDFWSGHARAIWNRWFLPLSSPAADAEVDKLLPSLVSLAGCLFRVFQRHGDDILRFLSYPHSFWPVYLSQGIMLRSVVRRHGEAEAIRYLREGGTQWWPEVPTLVKSRSWRAPDNATLTYLHKRELKPGTAAKFDLNRSGVTQDVVRRSIASMLDVINGARYGTGPPKPFPFLVASYSQPPMGSQWSSTITLQRGTPYVETTSSAAPSQSSGAVESQAPSSSTPRPVHVSSDGSISL
ncbi:hypothetical protein H310_13333 [Aphanomyces invadans]|uniref:Uncharacterized protein n=1 Tax=Aphanomyces invadans TaxID=157072 RepID=A0A024TDZ3_9STRA|nr:hypothetical protein H310_13333 [Aphanomyces invadans]ETV92268.1 hypothetical protein H310_13333 [Aphanomyces invadans]|eukprot:XP_008879019.1 hypothetical protein H310_13333 [Aphanomyces invadans]